MHSWLADPEVMRYLTWGAKTLDDSARHLDLCLAEQQQPQRRRHYLAVELRAVATSSAMPALSGSIRIAKKATSAIFSGNRIGGSGSGQSVRN
jgi:hypothetical protein